MERLRLRKSRATREQRGSGRCVIRDEEKRTLILISTYTAKNATGRWFVSQTNFQRDEFLVKQTYSSRLFVLRVIFTRWAINIYIWFLQKHENENGYDYNRRFARGLLASFRGSLDRSWSSLETGTTRPSPLPFSFVFCALYTTTPSLSLSSIDPTTLLLPRRRLRHQPSLYRCRSGPRPNLQNSQPRRSVKRMCNKLHGLTRSEGHARVQDIAGFCSVERRTSFQRRSRKGRKAGTVGTEE